MKISENNDRPHPDTLTHRPKTDCLRRLFAGGGIKINLELKITTNCFARRRIVRLDLRRRIRGQGTSRNVVERGRGGTRIKLHGHPLKSLNSRYSPIS